MLSQFSRLKVKKTKMPPPTKKIIDAEACQLITTLPDVDEFLLQNFQKKTKCMLVTMGMDICLL
jgi:hypothetical protein